MRSMSDLLVLPVAVDVYLTCHALPFSERRSGKASGQRASGYSVCACRPDWRDEDGHLKTQEPYQPERKLKLRKYLYFGLGANVCRDSRAVQKRLPEGS
jgi:hypothetical protein